MKKQRPVNLDLKTMKFPIPAIASILHRISGIILFLLIPVMLCILNCSLKSADDFARVASYFANPITKLLVWGFVSALIYHLLAGLRHIAMDMGFGETLSAGRTTARLVIALSLILIITAGWLLW